MTSKKATGTVFFVPNTPEGMAFIKQMRKWANRGVWRVIVRGRNPDRVSAAKKQTRSYDTPRAFRQSLRMEHSTYFAIYLNNEVINARRTKDFQTVYAELNAARAEVRMLYAELNRKQPPPKPLPKLATIRYRRLIRVE